MGFVNTEDLIGGDALVNAYLMRTLTEFRDDRITTLRGEAFKNCKSLVSVDLPSVTSANGHTFNNCAALENANLPLLSAVAEQMFRGCSSLKSIDLPALTGNTGYLAFESCKALESVNIPYATEIGVYSFQGCASLTKLDLPCVAKICTGGLQCVNLETVILRNNGVVTMENTNAFSGKMANGTGYIYVPKALVDSYKVATNWTTYANQIRAIEDHPDITGG